MATQNSVFKIKIEGKEQFVDLNALLKNTSKNIDEIKTKAASIQKVLANSVDTKEIKILDAELQKLNKQTLTATAKSFDDLRIKKDALEAAFKKAEFGTKEFALLQNELRTVNTQLKTVNDTVDGITVREKLEGVGKAAQAIGSGFAFASVSAQAFGEEGSKTAVELQKLELQVLALIQGQQALTGLIDIFTNKNSIFASSILRLTNLFNQLKTTILSFSLASRAALLATGIGVLTFAVAALIENFDKLKSKAGELTAAFKPFFNAIRDIGSVITFGLIDSTTLVNTKEFILNLNKDITKIQNESSQKLDTISKKAADTTQQKIENTKESIAVLNKELNKLAIEASKTSNQIDAILTREEALNNAELKRLQQTIDSPGTSSLEKKRKADAEAAKSDVEARNRVVGVLKESNDKIVENIRLNKVVAGDTTQLGLLSQALVQGSKDQVKENVALSKLFTEQKETAKVQLNTQSEKVAKTEEEKRIQRQADAERINSLLKIQQLEAEIRGERNKQDSANNDLIKQAIDLTLQFGNALQNPNFQKGFPVFDRFEEQLKLIQDRLGPQFKGIFDDLFTLDPNSKTVINIDKLQEAVNTFRDREKGRIQENGDLAVEKIQNQIKANNELRKIEIDPNRKAELLKENDLLQAQIKTIGVDTTKAIREVIDTTKILNDTIPDLSKKLNLEQAQKDFDKTERAANELFNSPGFKALSEVDQAAEIDRVNQQRIKFYKDQQLALAELAQTFPELTDALSQYNLALEQNERITRQDIEASDQRIKQLRTEIELLKNQGKVNGLTKTVNNDLLSFSTRKKALDEIFQLEKDQEVKIFNEKTKSLKANSDEYIKAEQELQNKLFQIDIKQFNDTNALVEKKIAKQKFYFDSVQQLSAVYFEFISQQNQLDQQNIQQRIEIVNAQLQYTQQAISDLDSLINARKTSINDLLAQADAAQGGQRQEILDKINQEVAATKRLTKEKELQAKAEDRIKKRQAQLEKDAQKAQRESIKIQKEAAVVAGILSAAQSAAAIATLAANSAKKDGTFGAATIAAIVALGIALVASIASTVSAIKGLNSSVSETDNTVPKAEGGWTGTSNKTPDQTGERPTRTYQLHEKEWIAPRWMTQSPRYAPIINDLENARTRGFADGGFTPIVSTINKLNPDAASPVSTAPIYVAVTDINDGQNRVKVIEQRSTF
jgi:hypothetical protein